MQNSKERGKRQYTVELNNSVYYWVETYAMKTGDSVEKIIQSALYRLVEEAEDESLSEAFELKKMKKTAMKFKRYIVKFNRGWRMCTKYGTIFPLVRVGK